MFNRNYPDRYSNPESFVSTQNMVHGEADNNSGTYPLQNERYFNALKGLGKIACLVMLPKESHGYRAKKPILHVLWEQNQ